MDLVEILYNKEKFSNVFLADLSLSVESSYFITLSCFLSDWASQFLLIELMKMAPTVLIADIYVSIFF